MSFDTIVAQALEAWFDSELADSITYAGSAIYAHVVYGQEPQSESNGQHDAATLIVKKSDVTTPAYRDAIVIGGNTWRMQRILSSDNWTWHISIMRDERPQPFAR